MLSAPGRGSIEEPLDDDILDDDFDARMPHHRAKRHRRASPELDGNGADVDDAAGPMEHGSLQDLAGGEYVDFIAASGPMQHGSLQDLAGGGEEADFIAASRRAVRSQAQSADRAAARTAGRSLPTSSSTC